MMGGIADRSGERFKRKGFLRMFNQAQGLAYRLVVSADLVRLAALAGAIAGGTRKFLTILLLSVKRYELH